VKSQEKREPYHNVGVEESPAGKWKNKFHPKKRKKKKKGPYGDSALFSHCTQKDASVSFAVNKLQIFRTPLLTNDDASCC